MVLFAADWKPALLLEQRFEVDAAGGDVAGGYYAGAGGDVAVFPDGVAQTGVA